MPKVRVWAVLGDSDAGKSTTIGHLTSRLNQGPVGIVKVLLRGGGYLHIYGKKMALQEAEVYPDDETTPAIDQKGFMTNINDRAAELQHNPTISAGYFNILIALRFNQVNNYPCGLDYLSSFVEKGWSIESLVLLSPTPEQQEEYGRFGAPTLSVDNSRNIEINHMVGQVRNHFGWA